MGKHHHKGHHKDKWGGVGQRHRGSNKNATPTPSNTAINGSKTLSTTNIPGDKTKHRHKHHKLFGVINKNGAKNSIGAIGKFGQKGLKTWMAPLTNLTKNPTTLIILLGLGAFIVLKIKK